MILYHGSNVIVDDPKRFWQSWTLAVGYGFYTITSRIQAVNLRVKLRLAGKVFYPMPSSSFTKKDQLLHD